MKDHESTSAMQTRLAAEEKAGRDREAAKRSDKVLAGEQKRQAGNTAKTAKLRQLREAAGHGPGVNLRK